MGFTAASLSGDQSGVVRPSEWAAVEVTAEEAKDRSSWLLPLLLLEGAGEGGETGGSGPGLAGWTRTEGTTGGV